MNKKEVRLRARFLQKDNARFSAGTFVDVPRYQWPAVIQKVPLKRVMRSRDFLVQIFEGTPTRLSIIRTTLNKAGGWQDGISWEEMQSIKDGCGFADQDAVEAYPRRCDIVNVANVRHIWIVPPEYADFFWRKGQGSGFKSAQTAEEIIEHPAPLQPFDTDTFPPRCASGISNHNKKESMDPKPKSEEGTGHEQRAADANKQAEANQQTDEQQRSQVADTAPGHPKDEAAEDHHGSLTAAIDDAQAKIDAGTADEHTLDEVRHHARKLKGDPKTALRSTLPNPLGASGPPNPKAGHIVGDPQGNEEGEKIAGTNTPLVAPNRPLE